MPWLNIVMTLFSTTLFLALAAILMFRRGWVLLPEPKDDTIDSDEDKFEMNWAIPIGTIIIVIALLIFLWVVN